MAKWTFEDAIAQQQNNFGDRVGFFSLKNNGDEAIVRFMYESTNDFEILSYHTVQVGDRTRKINCVREAHEAVSACPLCSRGENTVTRFFIKLIQYVPDENGGIVAVPKVWERSISYAKTLSDLMNEYGPLKNNLFKIKRNGAAGSRDTKYSIMYASPQVYPVETYPYTGNELADFSVLGNLITNPTVDELNKFVVTGVFPGVEQSQTSSGFAQQQASQFTQQTYTPPTLQQQAQPIPNEYRQTAWSQPQASQQTQQGVVPPKRTY